MIANGGVAAFPFHVTGHVFCRLCMYSVIATMLPNLISLLVYGYPKIYFFIYFSVGDARSCASAFFPGNDYLDKLEREKAIVFVVGESEFSEFVGFDRDTAWCYLTDDDRKDVHIISICSEAFTFPALHYLSC